METLNHMKDLNTDLSLLSEEFSNRIEKIKQKYIEQNTEPLGVGWYANIFTKGLFGYRLKDDGNFSIEVKEISTNQRISDPHYWVRPDEFDSSEITRLMTDECKRRFMGKTVLDINGHQDTLIKHCIFEWSNLDGVPCGKFWFKNNPSSNYWICLWSAEKGFAEVVEEESPKDGKWFECRNTELNSKFIIKHKSKGDISESNNYIEIDESGFLLENSWSAFFDTAREITPEEALPYIEKWATKEGFIDGVSFKSAINGVKSILGSKIRTSEDFSFYGGTPSGGCLFDNKTNTFATLVIEDKITVGGDDVVKGQYHYLKFKNAILNKRDLESWEEIIELGGKIEFNGEVLTIEKINQLRELANK